jgi:hypothetical protein
MAAFRGTIAPGEGPAHPNEFVETDLTGALVGRADSAGSACAAHLGTQRSALTYLRAEARTMAMAERSRTADGSANMAMVLWAFVHGFDAALTSVDQALAEWVAISHGQPGPCSDTAVPRAQ